GHDVWHTEFGHGWVQGSGLGRVTVRFETPGSPPGRVRTFRTDDPGLRPADPLPQVRGGDDGDAGDDGAQPAADGTGWARPRAVRPGRGQAGSSWRASLP